MGKILYAEDDEAMREMVTDILLAAGHEVRTVSDGISALAEMRRSLPDLVLLDYRMGDPDGFEVCRRIKTDARIGHLPVLMLTAETDIEDRIEGFAAGANDYLPKPFDSRELLARVGAMLRLSEQGKELNPTTGLPGGSAIEREFDRRRKEGVRFTLCYLDLDYFKPFNDRFGFPVANTLIESVGTALRELVADSSNFAGHIGGDDFVVICSPEEARDVVTRAQARFDEAVKKHVPAEVAAKGTYWGQFRDGSEGDVPLTRLGAALIHLEPDHLPALEELSEFAATAKKAAKEEKESGTVEIEWAAGEARTIESG